MLLLLSSSGYSQYLLDENFNEMTDGQYVPPAGWVFGQGEFPTLDNFELSFRLER